VNKKLQKVESLAKVSFYGSVCELETQILLAGDLDLILDPWNPWTPFSN
jgi:hypothetical protein